MREVITTGFWEFTDGGVLGLLGCVAGTSEKAVGLKRGGWTDQTLPGPGEACVLTASHLQQLICGVPVTEKPVYVLS